MKLPPWGSIGTFASNTAKIGLLASIVMGGGKSTTPPTAPAKAATAFAGEIYPRLIIPAGSNFTGVDPDAREACQRYAGGLAVYSADSQDAMTYGWSDMAMRAGGAPVVLYLEPGNKLNRTGKPDAASVVADLKAIRGVK